MSIDAEKEVSRIKQLDPTFDEISIFDIIQPIYGKNYFVYLIAKHLYTNIFRELFKLFG